MIYLLGDVKVLALAKWSHDSVIQKRSTSICLDTSRSSSILGAKDMTLDNRSKEQIGLET